MSFFKVPSFLRKTSMDSQSEAFQDDGEGEEQLHYPPPQGRQLRAVQEEEEDDFLMQRSQTDDMSMAERSQLQYPMNQQPYQPSYDGQQYPYSQYPPQQYDQYPPQYPPQPQYAPTGIAEYPPQDYPQYPPQQQQVHFLV